MGGGLEPCCEGGVAVLQVFGERRSDHLTSALTLMYTDRFFIDDNTAVGRPSRLLALLHGVLVVKSAQRCLY